MGCTLGKERIYFRPALAYRFDVGNKWRWICSFVFGINGLKIDPVIFGDLLVRDHSLAKRDCIIASKKEDSNNVEAWKSAEENIYLGKKLDVYV